MSGLLGLFVPSAVGLAIGAVLGIIVSDLRQTRRDGDPRRSMSESDRAAIEAEFATHAAAVRAQAAEYADVLAGGDQLLRARLRRLENRRQWA